MKSTTIKRPMPKPDTGGGPIVTRKAEQAEEAAPAFDRAQAKQVSPVRHQPTQRTINYTQRAECGRLHCFTGRGEFIATLAALPKQ